MKLENIGPRDVGVLPEVNRSAVTFLWFNDFFDGPLSRLAEMNGTRYLFDMIDRSALGDEDEDRRYWLISLTDNQLDDELRWHEWFCNNVGTHFDLTGRAPLPRELVDMDAFYVPFRDRVPPDYSQNDIVGWFRL